MHQKMAIGVKFRVYEVEELHCLCSGNKGTDELRGSDREANLRLCSRICKKQAFSRSSIIDNLLANLLHCGSFNADKSGKNRVIRVILSEEKQEQFSIYLKHFLNEY